MMNRGDNPSTHALPYIPSNSREFRTGVRRQNLRLLLWRYSLAITHLTKRALDLTIAGTMLLLCLPLFAVVAVAIYLENPGPIFFIQKRVGLNGRLFPFFKFRSMIVNAEALKAELARQNESADGVIFKMKRDPRVTIVGRFIRRFSIDELPQVLNVIRGEMSIVGPRPPVPREVEQYGFRERQRLMVKPGLTCIWQVSGRSDVPFHQQVEMDFQYIREQSLWADLALIVRTVPAVLLGKGAY